MKYATAEAYPTNFDILCRYSNAAQHGATLAFSRFTPFSGSFVARHRVLTWKNQVLL